MLRAVIVSSSHAQRAPALPVRAALAAAFGLATAPAAYAWVRALEGVMVPRSNPLAVVAVTQSGFFARCGIAVFVGGMGAFAGWALAARTERAARWLVIAVAVSWIALAAQIGLAP